MSTATAVALYRAFLRVARGASYRHLRPLALGVPRLAAAEKRVNELLHARRLDAKCLSRLIRGAFTPPAAAAAAAAAAPQGELALDRGFAALRSVSAWSAQAGALALYEREAAAHAAVRRDRSGVGLRVGDVVR